MQPIGPACLSIHSSAARGGARHHPIVETKTKEHIMKRIPHLALLAVACLLSLTLLVLACGSSTADPVAGDLYSVETGDGTFSIVKVLAAGDGLVHLRLYKHRFATRPPRVDPGELSLGSIQDPDGFGIGHLPISLSEFRAWDPEFLTSEPVTEEELEGYRFWQEQVGGSSGD
jgi:hypothetical protein